MTRRGARFVCLAVIAILYLFSIPWYRNNDAPLTLWFGLPDWVAVALLCYVGVAVFNAIAWMLCDISDEITDTDEFAASASKTRDATR